MRIVSDGTISGTTIFDSNGKDITNELKAIGIKVDMQPFTAPFTKATITCLVENVDIVADDVEFKQESIDIREIGPPPSPTEWVRKG